MAKGRCPPQNPSSFQHIFVIRVNTDGVDQTLTNACRCCRCCCPGEDDADDGDLPAVEPDRTGPLPAFECAPGFFGQLKAVMWQVWLQAQRNPIGMIHLVIAPVLFTYLATLVVPFMRDAPPTKVSLMHRENGAGCSSHMWAGNMSLAGLGQLSKAMSFPTCEALVRHLARGQHAAGWELFGKDDGYVAFCHNGGAAGSDVGWGGIPKGAATNR